ncbi:MAG: acyltransferase [Patescibacteria group bacterium]|jgi:hypothetical protein
MKNFITQKNSFLVKLSQKKKKTIIILSFFITQIRLKYFFKLKKVGKLVKIFTGFRVFHGANNITVGNNVNLVDALLSAGDNNGSIEIQDYVFFGHRVMLLARKHDYNETLQNRQDDISEAPILIKKGAWIGSGAIILGGITIGENAVVGAGSIVTKNVADNAVVAGNPAKLIKYINQD